MHKHCTPETYKKVMFQAIYRRMCRAGASSCTPQSNQTNQTAKPGSHGTSREERERGVLTQDRHHRQCHRRAPYSRLRLPHRSALRVPRALGSCGFAKQSRVAVTMRTGRMGGSTSLLGWICVRLVVPSRMGRRLRWAKFSPALSFFLQIWTINFISILLLN
jgi:hypothetical protein